MKKILVSLLCAVMMVTFMPSMAFADSVVNASSERDVTNREELTEALNDSSVSVINVKNDIQMGTEKWTPVTIERNLIINGENHIITGMKVNEGVLKPSGSGVAGDGGSCDYYAGFVGNCKASLTINNISFSEAEVDINPLTINKNSTGSSILAVVCANNMGTVELNNVNVNNSVVRGYSKVGILHGFTQGNGSFTANKCSLENNTVVLEADGSDKEAAFSGIIIGYDGKNHAKTNGIKLSGNKSVIDSSVNWDQTPVKSETTGVTSVGNWGLTCDTYTHGSNGTDAVLFEAEVDGYQYETLEDAVNAASSGQSVRVLRDINLSSQLTVDKKIVLNLNGKTISNNADIWNDSLKHWSYVSVVDGGELTITGNGVMQTKENDCYAIDLRGGNCNIENGTFIGNVHAVYVYDGVLNVYGGNFSVQQKFSDDQPDQFVLNCFDKNYKDGTAKITVYGGTYAGFNPGNCEAEGKGTDFLASGYEVKENGDNTFTVEKTYVPPYIPPVNPPASDNVTNDADDKTTNADIDTTVSTDGKAEATVDQTTADKIVDKAVANGSTEITIDATTSAGKADAAEVKLPAETVAQLVEKTDADIIVKTDAAEVKLDQEAAKAITETASTGTVSIIVEKTKDESAEMRFELKVVTENGAVSDFKGGTAAVTVKLNDSLKDKELVCVYIDENGRYHKVKGEKDVLKGIFTFFTEHFSTYAIMEADAADRIIEEQTNARLKAGVENTTIKLYYNKKEIGKGWIKLRYKKSYGYKVENYEIFRSAKKKTNFGDEAWFVTKTNKTKGYYKNGKSVKKGTRYYYKMRGVREIAGETVYTQWSNIVMRTGR